MKKRIDVGSCIKNGKRKILVVIEIFEMLTEYASEHYYDKFGFNNEELAGVRDEIIKLQNQYSNMGLTDEQKNIIDNLLKLHTEIYKECLEKIYAQGLKDCVIILKEFGIL